MATIANEENVAVDAEMTEVISQKTVIRAWTQFRHSSRHSSALKGKTCSCGTYAIVLYKKTGDDI